MSMDGLKVLSSGVNTQLGSGAGVCLEGERFHFIGAGGVGMSGLAKLLLKKKAIVSGSDETGSVVLGHLGRLGADIKIGHNAEHLASETGSVVISAAIRGDNPELLAARESGCRIYKYAEMLGLLMGCYDGIAISGTHGKSTTSGWLVYCLKEAGVDPSFIVGAEISQLGTSSGVGESSRSRS